MVDDSLFLALSEDHFKLTELEKRKLNIFAAAHVASEDYNPNFFFGSGFDRKSCGTNLYLAALEMDERIYEERAIAELLYKPESYCFRTVLENAVSSLRDSDWGPDKYAAESLAHALEKMEEAEECV